MGPLKILYLGALWEGSTTLQRMKALIDLGHDVKGVDIEPDGQPVDRSLFTDLPRRVWQKVRCGIGRRPQVHLDADINYMIIKNIHDFRWDILWIDKGLSIGLGIIQTLRSIHPECCVIGYSPDDMSRIHNQSVNFIEHLPQYDFFFTTKSYGVKELKTLGCRNPVFINNAYCASLHRPVQVTEDERLRYGGRVGFIGAYERSRSRYLHNLAASGIPVRIWGSGWERCLRKSVNLKIEHRALWGDEYVKAICSFDINLCFLRKINRDLQTTRSIEIPACGAFMLAERTEEHRGLFEEGKEAEFFAGTDELVAKSRHYLLDEKKRKKVAEAGRIRCINSGYSNAANMKRMLEIATGDNAAASVHDD